MYVVIVVGVTVVEADVGEVIVPAAPVHEYVGLHPPFVTVLVSENTQPDALGFATATVIVGLAIWMSDKLSILKLRP